MTEHAWFTFDDKNREHKWLFHFFIADPPTGKKVATKAGLEISQLKSDGTVVKFDTSEMKNDHFSMLNRGKKVKVTTWFGVEAAFLTKNFKIEVDIPACYKQCTKGICGNWNGNAEDDLENTGNLEVRGRNIN